MFAEAGVGEIQVREGDWRTLWSSDEACPAGMSGCWVEGPCLQTETRVTARWPHRAAGWTMLFPRAQENGSDTVRDGNSRFTPSQDTANSRDINTEFSPGW